MRLRAASIRPQYFSHLHGGEDCHQGEASEALLQVAFLALIFWVLAHASEGSVPAWLALRSHAMMEKVHDVATWHDREKAHT